MQASLSSVSAAEAVRATVTRVLGEATAAAARLRETADPEALHDVRVSLRRLRVLLRAYESELERIVPGWLAEDVAALAKRTGGARDAEVFCEWLAPRINRLGAGDRSTARWLLERTEARRDASYRTLRRVIPRELANLEPLLRAALEYRPPRERPSSDSKTFRELTARRAGKRMDDLLKALDKIGGEDDDEDAHEARIAAKKVRYILEPALPDRAKSILKGLKALQDDLGTFHDLAEARARVIATRRARGPAGEASSARRLAAMDRLLTRVQREKTALFRRIRRDWLTGPRTRLWPARRWVRAHREAPKPAVPGGRKGARPSRVATGRPA
jgi:CHAD domain-containing protein